MKRLSLGIFLVVALAGVVLASTSIAEANHSWNGYHWARTSNPFTLKLGDNVSTAWDSYLGQASSDWSQSTVLDTSIVPGQGKSGSLCRPTNGRVEVCNASYGPTGWLGIAQIWPDAAAHITQARVAVNDYYFKQTTYNTPAWKTYVMCQEVGHTFGLGHTDENQSNPNQGTCMDYTNDPARNDGFGNNLQPNAHDYAELGIIYAHLDSTTTVGAPPPSGARGNFDEPSEWGKLVSGRARSGAGSVAVYERDLGGGSKVVTFVIWAD